MITWKNVCKVYAMAQGALFFTAPAILALITFKWWGLLVMLSFYMFPIKIRIYDSIQDWVDEHGDVFIKAEFNEKDED